MTSERVCLSTLRGISTRVAAILDRYPAERAIWVPAPAFEQFMHTLYWGSFADLDLRLLDGLEAGDYRDLVDELRAYNAYLHRQRERVSHFHRAYRGWLETREKELPAEYREQLRCWHQCYGSYDYYRITGLATQSGYQRFIADPQRSMDVFERAFAELAAQRERERAWREQAEADWWSNTTYMRDGGRTLIQVEQALQHLGLSPGATLDEIKQAYRARAKAVHPDRQGEDSTAQMVALNQAYELLCRFHHTVASEVPGTGG